MIPLPDWLRRHRAQQLVNWKRVRTVAAASTGSMRPGIYTARPFYVVNDAYVGGVPPVYCRSLDPPFDIFEEAIGFPERRHGMIKRFLREDLRAQLARPLEIALCLRGPYESYWHWTFEYLLKAVLAEEAGFRGIYLVPPHPYAAAAIAHLGIAPERIVIHSGQLWRIAKLWVTSPFHGDELLRQPEVLARLRAAMLLGAPSPAKRGIRAYISRNRPGLQRQIVNEAALKPILERFGFTEYFAEDHSVAEQVSFFSGCDAVIGSYGAGFANATYMPERSLVIDLVSALRYEGLAVPSVKLLKQRYVTIMPFYDGKVGYHHGNNVVANLDMIECTLEREFC